MAEKQRDNDTDRYELSTWLNPGKSQGRPNENPGLEAHRSKRPTRLRSPKEAPVPDLPTLRSDPDRASKPQFHASISNSAKVGSAATQAVAVGISCCASGLALRWDGKR